MTVREGVTVERESETTGSWRRPSARVGPAATFGALVLVTWQAFVVLANVPTVVLPSPVAVGTTLVESAPMLLADAVTTALTAGGGLLVGASVGASLAFLTVRSDVAPAVVHPTLVALRIAPLVAIAPVVFLWFGDGLPARVLLVATMTTFPVTIASIDGLRATPNQYLDLLATVDTSPRETFFRVRVPAAAPSVFAGLKLAAVLSVTGTVVTEFLTLDGGIGYRVFHTSTTLQTRTTYAALAVLAVLGLAFYFLPVALERRTGW